MEQGIDPDTGYHWQIRYENHRINCIISINQSASDDFSDPDYSNTYNNISGDHSVLKESIPKRCKSLWHLEEADKANLEKRRERELRNG